MSVRTAVATMFRALLDLLALVRSDAYRPERHYMRGSGPKSRSRRNKPEASSK